MPVGFKASLLDTDLIEQRECKWLVGDELPQGHGQLFFSETQAYWLQIKRDFVWAFVLNELGNLQLFKVAGHLEGNTYRPKPRAEARHVGWGTLDGWTVKAGLFVEDRGDLKALFLYLEKPPEKWGARNVQKLHLIKTLAVPDDVKESVNDWFGGGAAAGPQQEWWQS